MNGLIIWFGGVFLGSFLWVQRQKHTCRLRLLPIER